MLPEDDDGKKEGAFADRTLVLKFPPLAAPLPPLGLDWDMVVVVVVVVRNPMLLQCKGRYDQTNGHRCHRRHRSAPWRGHRIGHRKVTRKLCFKKRVLSGKASSSTSRRP